MEEEIAEYDTTIPYDGNEDDDQKDSQLIAANAASVNGSCLLASSGFSSGSEVRVCKVMVVVEI